MAAVIRLKRSEIASTSPTSSDLSVGEVAINTADQKIFVKDSNNNIITLGISNVIDDNIPQLGGNLDVNGNDIVSTSNGNINLSPNGTGSVVINTDLDVDNINLNGNQISATDADGDIWIQQNGVGSIYLDDVEIQNASIQSRYDNGSFNINSKGTGSLFLDDLKIKDATIESYGTNQDITLSPDGTGTVIIDTDLEVDNLNLNGNTISSVNTDGNIILTPNGSGIVNASNLTINSAITFPTSDGSEGQVLQTDGEGNLQFVDQSSGGTGGTDLAVTIALG
jgi:hypothetical protein